MQMELKRRHRSQIHRVEVIREARECGVEGVKALLQLLLALHKLLILLRKRQVIRESIQGCNI